jgi:DNA-directed RNA polymerase subunit RPC12/RpoP
MATRKKSATRARTARRHSERRLEKLARDRARLAKLEAGGSPERPIEVASSAVVDMRVAELRCTRCEAPLRSQGDVAIASSAHVLRKVDAACVRCGERRIVYVRVVHPLLS